MCLAKAVEDAFRSGYIAGNKDALEGNLSGTHYDASLASLPEPKTEKEILEIIMAANEWNDGGMVLPNNARNIIRALREAGVLYCKEEK